MNCNLCPRKCNIDRSVKTGFCGVSDITVSRVAPHMWEEPPISGTKGSGTVFFAGCNLRCRFCQNFDITVKPHGVGVSVNRLADLFLHLCDTGVANINLVTAAQFADKVAAALNLCKHRLTIPVVYNTSSYEKAETIKMLAGIVDIYLPDFKYFDNKTAKKYSSAPDYVEYSKAAIEEMVRQQPECVFDENGIIQKGVIVRHLVMPGQTESAKKAVKYLYDTYGDKVFISIMSQYTPCTDLSAYPEINRKLTREEYDDVVNYAVDIGVENGFIQEGESASESFIPPFNLEGVD